MKLYEIDRRITDLIDPESGEVLDLESFVTLQFERDSKIENIALWIKDLNAESEAIKAEKNALAERERATANKADKLKSYLDYILCGEKFKTPKVEISYRKSFAVEIEDEASFIDWATANDDTLLTYKLPAISKKAVGDLIKSGADVPYAKIVERNNITLR